MSQIAQTLGYPLTAVHVPKTVDNDLAVTDNCPGFGSVAKYVATSMREAAFDVASMAKTSTKVFVLEVMGRHAGWITAAVGMAEDAATPIPLLLLFPEIPFDEAKFVAAVDAKVARNGYCCIGVSEGLQDASGKLMAEAGTRDAFGHAQLGGVGPLIANLVKERLGLQVPLGGRRLPAARGAPPRVEDRPRAIVRGRQGGSRAGARRPQRRHAGDPARLGQAVSLEDRRGAAFAKSPTRRRCCRATSSSADGFGITAKARAYLAPLIRGEAPPPYRDGLPQYVRLKNIAVPKKLSTGFDV